MGAVQHVYVLMTAISCRTVTEPAVLVVTGVIPIDLLARERKKIYKRQEVIDKSYAEVEERQNNGTLAGKMERKNSWTLGRKTHQEA